MYYENDVGRVYYELAGPKGAPALVFCHGVSLNHETFNPQMDALKENYQVIVWDMPYHGMSSPIDNKLQFSIIAADFVVELLDECNIGDAVIVGQSLGSFVAQQAMHKYPERVKGTVHIGGVPLCPKFNALLKVFNPLIALSIYLFPSKPLYKAFAKHKALTEETRSYMEKTSTKAGKSVISHLTQEMLRDMTKGLPELLKEPQLLCYGDHDLGFIKKLSQKWHEKNPNSQLAVVENAHHIANQDNSEEFNKVLISFLESYSLQKNKPQ